MNLWPHQVKALDLCEKAQTQPRSRLLFQCPPGSGKSEIAVRAALRWLSDRPFSRAMVVVQTAPVLEQFHRRLAFATRIPVAIEKAERRAPRGARLVLASQNSLWDRLGSYPRDVLCIYDEIHHSNLDAECNLSIAEQFDHVWGLDASPWSRGCERLLGGQPHVQLGLAAAIAQGILAPYELRAWIPPRGPHGIVFCCSNAEAEELSRGHAGSTWIGVNSGHVAARIAAWRATRYPVIYCNRMLIEGVDSPECCEVWITKETDSDIMNLQMPGRAMRFRPGKVARIYCRTEEVRVGVERALERACGTPRT